MSATRPGAIPWVTLCLVAAGVAATAIPGAGAALEYDRARVAAGELGRLATASFTHWTGRMAFWDLLVVGVAGALVERRSRLTVVAAAALAVAGTAVAVRLDPGGVASYRGSSGLATALFVAAGAGLVLDARSVRGRAIGLAALGLLAGKVALESLGGHPVAAGELPAGVRVLPLVHVAGGIAGLLAATMITWTSWRSGRSSPRTSGS